MKGFLMVVMVFSVALAVNKATKPYTFSTGAIRASEMNKNFDTVYTKFNGSVDTLNRGVPRWASMLYHCDSTWQYMNIDTIAGKVNMDTVVDLDTIYSDKAHFKKIESDTVKGNITYKEPGASYFQHAYTINDTNRLRVELNSIHDVIYTTCGSNFTWRRLIGSTYANVFRLDSADTSFRVYGRMGIGQTPTTYRLSVNGLVSASGVTTNGDDTLIYGDTTFYDSLFGASYIARITVRLVEIGATITMYQAGLTGDISGSTSAEIRGVPSKYMPTTKQYNVPVIIYNNGASQTGIAQVNLDGKIHILPQNFGNLDGGVCGLAGCTISWIK
jgi:hypothetical protein